MDLWQREIFGNKGPSNATKSKEERKRDRRWRRKIDERFYNGEWDNLSAHRKMNVTPEDYNYSLGLSRDNLGRVDAEKAAKDLLYYKHLQTLPIMDQINRDLRQVADLDAYMLPGRIKQIAERMNINIPADLLEDVHNIDKDPVRTFRQIAVRHLQAQTAQHPERQKAYDLMANEMKNLMGFNRKYDTERAPYRRRGINPDNRYESSSDTDQENRRRAQRVWDRGNHQIFGKEQEDWSAVVERQSRGKRDLPMEHYPNDDYRYGEPTGNNWWSHPQHYYTTETDSDEISSDNSERSVENEWQTRSQQLFPPQPPMDEDKDDPNENRGGGGRRGGTMTMPITRTQKMLHRYAVLNNIKQQHFY